MALGDRISLHRLPRTRTRLRRKTPGFISESFAHGKMRLSKRKIFHQIEAAGTPSGRLCGAIGFQLSAISDDEKGTIHERVSGPAMSKLTPLQIRDSSVPWTCLNYAARALSPFVRFEPAEIAPTSAGRPCAVRRRQISRMAAVSARMTGPR